MSKILYVVHRAAPYPGGSEYYVRDMAEESLKRGHRVTVLANEHKGDLNGISVTSDYNVLSMPWDLIIVHGGDVISQNIVHYNAYTINKISPVVYVIIKPSTTEICLNGIKHHRYLAYSTSMDINHIKKYGDITKARRIRHGVVPNTTIMPKTLREDKRIFVSAGGFYQHKAMIPLAHAFETSNIQNAELHLYGYGEGQIPQTTDKVKSFFGLPKNDVMQAIANADAYVMNSYEEGFGLVLLEAMMNKTPWFARNIAGAKDMSMYGTIYEDTIEVIHKLLSFKRDDAAIEYAYNHAMSTHTISCTVDDIEDIFSEL